MLGDYVFMGFLIACMIWAGAMTVLLDCANRGFSFLNAAA
jgi:hypothetical protein